MNKKEEEVEIDLMRLARALLKKSWAIILAAVIFGGCALTYTTFFVTPLYKARTLLYVNTSSLSMGDAKVSISSGDLSTAKGLIDTYVIILKTRSTLEEVIEEAKLPYSYEVIRGMVDAAPVNGTQIFYVEATSTDPKEAEVIANSIGRVLPSQIASIVEGSSARIVDYAVVPAHKSSPNLSKNTTIGVILGILISGAIIVIRELMDDAIHSTDFLRDTYDLPILAAIPELTADAGSNYSNYSYSYGGSNSRRKEANKK